jgi:hypothetical protein
VKKVYQEDGRDIWFVKAPIGEKILSAWSKKMAINLGLITHTKEYSEIHQSFFSSNGHQPFYSIVGVMNN